MKIRRFFAGDMRQAIRKVGKEMGPEAVILSNKKVLGGVEVVAAIEVDEALLKQHASPATQAPKANSEPASIVIPPTEAARPTELHAASSAFEDIATRASAPRFDADVWSQDPTLQNIRSELNDLRALLERQLSGLAWGEMARRHPLRAKLIRALSDLGVSAELSRAICDQIPDDMAPQSGWQRALEIFSASIPVASDDALERGGFIALVGPTGVGKTTTIAKLAARYSLRYGRKRIALVTLDNYRIGAHEQLRTYGRIMDVPVYSVKNADEMRNAVKDLVDKDLVLVDTAGMSQRDARVGDQFEVLNAAQPHIKNYLVMSATTQANGLMDVAQVYKGLELHGCILTKLDETLSLGGALSTAIAQRLAISYINDGQRVPEDIHLARANNLVNRAVSLAQKFPQTSSSDALFERAMRGAGVNANV